MKPARAAERERLAAEQAGREARAEARRQELRKERDAIAADFAASADLRNLDETVDAALRFNQEGKLEETETAARHLIDRHPDIPDGWEFLGHVHETRDENREAVARQTTSTRSTRKGSKTGSPDRQTRPAVGPLTPRHGRVRRRLEPCRPRRP
jgi:soluble cytochrome b562